MEWKADFLARKGTTTLQRSKALLAFHSAKRMIKLESNKDKLLLNNYAKDKIWECLASIILDFPRASAVTMFRLLTGHDCLFAHLFKVGLSNYPNRILCNSRQTMNWEHLDTCTAFYSFNSVVQKYWEARRPMA
ncbi:uncharacterized protein [Parasteatoda tepidariorum]|uniref:uncharacterized protein n=1 Tax=Parasteatoda tepidariorum TaxID=114398 RepID=UPI001C722445|nr:uncharacterized protein LOC107436469 [Parasteatoda tepidariorum]